MILQALKEYYDRKASDPESDIAPEGWEKKEIPFIIVLDHAGNLMQIEDTREGEGKKKRAKAFLVPQAEKKTSGIAANLLWENAGYVLGIATKGNNERAIKQKNAFIDRLTNELGDIKVVQAVIAFLTNVTEERLSQEECWQEISASNPNLSFRMSADSFLICRHPDVVSRLSSTSQSSNDISGTCLVTGKNARIKVLHTSIKGVYGAQTAGANIVSFNLDAFKSYGKEQGFNAPVGAEAEFSYTTAINTLLGRDSKQRLLIGDASTVFWSKKQSSFESEFSSFFEEPEKDNPDAGTQNVKALFESIHSGAYREDDGKTPFYILGLAPNAARIAVRFWQIGTIAEIAVRIHQYFKDFAIVKPPREPEYYSIWRILVNIATQDKSENIPPNLAGDFMRSILTGMPYPATLLQAVLRRIRSDTENRVKPVRAALIKAYLNRYYQFYPDQNQREVQMELDISQPSIGYQLGRLFATLEKIQEEANPGINATIRERFYGAACATPVTVFTNLLRLKNHHLAKLDNKGRVVNFERLLGEIIGNLKDFPAQLDLHEQGRFAIGYYHQRQDFFTSKGVAESDK
ncbi:type I-C CRISPR-associated protein Cas8c/Csd1 [Acetonema longum]|uniref:Csd1 family CRISPR-associated protein n=1 Tax=Acetonema longum DSM 6540 TaxID=1009370 RepID=F7NGQ7_9FIRM|nr:type I-C CRISPR-associated protein Cas8c/Csd1 [Acetonema longum]EGO64861.1 Csd1 family CRISPR-associated protein [Acetonema longum DSM 6540]